MQIRKENPLYEEVNECIVKFCKEPTIISYQTNKSVIAKEIRLYTRLKTQYPFGIKYVDLPFKINTLCFFFTEKGKEILENYKNKYKENLSENTRTEYAIQSPKQSLLNFINT